MLGAGPVVGLRLARSEPAPPTVAPCEPGSRALTTPPDGQIAFSRTIFDPATNTPTGGDIWSVATDGSDLVAVDRPARDRAGPRPGPRTASASRSLGIDSVSTGDIWLIDADPTAADRHLTQLTDGAGLEVRSGVVARWAIDRLRRRLAGAPSVWIRSADGTGEARRVVDGNWPSWTPDGTRLLVTVGTDFTDTEAWPTSTSTAASRRSCRSGCRTPRRVPSTPWAGSPSCRARTTTRTRPVDLERGRLHGRARWRPRPVADHEHAGERPLAALVVAVERLARLHERRRHEPGRASRSSFRRASRSTSPSGAYDAFPAWRPEPAS